MHIHHPILRINHLKYIALLILILSNFSTTLFAQKKSDLKPDEIIDIFIKKIGGDNWLHLKSRKQMGFVTREETKNYMLDAKSYYQTKVHLNPGMYIDLHRFLTGKTTAYVVKPECIWHYSSSNQSLYFFDPEQNVYSNKYPRTLLMEVLNLEAMKKSYIEDTLYRVDFKDVRMLEGKRSLFFGMNSGLLYKSRYVNKNSTVWVYHFSDYEESDGFMEPRSIRLTGGGEDFMHISIDSILYNIEVDPKIFSPPSSCKSFFSREYVDIPYEPEIH